MHIFQFVTSLEFIFDLKYNRRSINASDSDINIYEYNDYLGINILYSLPVYLDFGYTYTERICISLATPEEFTMAHQ